MCTLTYGERKTVSLSAVLTPVANEPTSITQWSTKPLSAVVGFSNIQFHTKGHRRKVEVKEPACFDSYQQLSLQHAAADKHCEDEKSAVCHYNMNYSGTYALLLIICAFFYEHSTIKLCTDFLAFEQKCSAACIRLLS